MNDIPTDSRPLNCVLLGPPGSGKSTIAEGLSHRFPFVLISTGEWLRKAIAMRVEIGRQVEAYLQRGELAPDSLMDRVLRQVLVTLDPGQGLLLDGYPRTRTQAIGLFGMLADYGRTLDAVIALDVSDAEVERRLSGRRICECNGTQFPVHIDDLASMLRCKERGGRPVQRTDDRPEIVRQRLEVYHKQTAPLFDYYAAEGLILRIDAQAAPADVARRAIAALEEIAVG